jgi:hypothetical protein
MMAAKSYHKQITHDHEWIARTNFIAPNHFSKFFSSYSNKYTLDTNDTNTSATQKKLSSQTGKETPQQERNDAATAPTTTQRKHKTMPP